MICWGHLGHLMSATPVGAQGLGGPPGQVKKGHPNGVALTKIDVQVPQRALEAISSITEHFLRLSKFAHLTPLALGVPTGGAPAGCPRWPLQIINQASTSESEAISPLEHVVGLPMSDTTPSIGLWVPSYAPLIEVPRDPPVGSRPVGSGPLRAWSAEGSAVRNCM